MLCRLKFKSHLKSSNSGTLESEISLEVLSNLTDQPLEGKFSDKQLSALLVSSDFPQGDRSGPVTGQPLRKIQAYKFMRRNRKK